MSTTTTPDTPPSGRLRGVGTATVARKLGAFTVLGLALLTVQGVTSRVFTSDITEDAEQVAKMSDAIRAAALADMYHDGLHAGVLLALTSDDPATQAQARAEITDAGDSLRSELRNVKEADIGTAVDDAVDAQAGGVDLYVQRGLAVVDAIESGQDPRPAQLALEEQYLRLEEDLPAVADSIDAASRRASAAFHAARDSSETWTITIGAIALVLLGVTSFRLTRSLVRPIRATSAVLGAVAAGDLSRRVETTTRDEVGEMAASLNTALDNLGLTMTTIGEHATSLSSAAEELTAVSAQLVASAEQTSAQAGIVAATAGQVSDNLSVVASGTGEMNLSIQEISHGAQDAVSVADHAAVVAQSTNDTVAKLGMSSAEIGNVVKVITSIAEQTNLLALNATIEAARAGEAGKGFAVVAHEVKELASATTAATADISERIGAIQTDATDAVRAIGEITDIIGRVGETQSSIASAVEQQTATTNEIGRNVAEAADNSTEIARNITGVANAAEDASNGATNTLDTASELSRMAGELRELVAGFRC